MRKIGVEGGVWALVSDDGATVELIDPPPELRRSGVRARIDPDTDRPVDVSVGMVGRAVRVRSFTVLG